MLATGTQPAAGHAPELRRRSCVALEFAIDGDLRFLSHHDELRMLARALRRAGWPVAYSQGFNPQPRVVLPLPRSVGLASACEWALVELNEPRPAEQLGQSLAPTLPSGCRLRRVVALEDRVKPHARRVVYAVALQPQHVAKVGSAIERLLAAETLSVERGFGPNRPARTIDIRPYIEKVTLEGRTLLMRLGFTAQRTARPTEVLTALSLPADEYNHRVRRVEVEWDIELAGPAAGPAGVERNNIGREESCHAQTQDNDA